MNMVYLGHIQLFLYYQLFLDTALTSELYLFFNNPLNAISAAHVHMEVG